MAFVLGTRAVAAGYRLASYDTIGSTSTEALARARAGDPGRLWIVAREQSSGHGRRGRNWQTPAGNLAASLLMPFAGPRAASARLGFVAGLALDEAIRQVAPEVVFSVALDEATGSRARLRLKWPNDILVDGAKVAGILLETAGEGDGVVIGIGVNVCHAPEGVPYPATSLQACGAGVSPEALFTALSDAWVAQAELWNSDRGFGVVRESWLARAAGLGQPVAVKVGEDVFRGTFETIDAEGRLIVRSPDGSMLPVSAGDVHFGAVATARI